MKGARVTSFCLTLSLLVLASANGCAELESRPIPAAVDAGLTSTSDANADADTDYAAMPGAVTMLTTPRGAHVLRIASYNIEKNSVFEAGHPQTVRFLRLAKVIDADIWALQEVWASPEYVAAWFNAALPLPNGATWAAMDAGSTMTVTRFTVRHHQQTTPPHNGRKVGLTWLDVPDTMWQQDLYLANLHMSCCGDGEISRQQEADGLAAWLQRLKTVLSPIPLAPKTPIMLIGDFNLVSGLAPLQTLLLGDISDEKTWGPDAPPDWDGTALRDIRPRHNGDGTATWTWRTDGSGYTPGRLDYALVTDSTTDVVGALALNTTTLSDTELAILGLQRLDVGKRRFGAGWQLDHLPLVIDLVEKAKP
ncbi:MAG: endonuclease/exonuclease/phosphatase family protein [Myxococcales bacterium]|nr:endonuclease/exonuclease/phosphatase family protein [Myxococcales bacterium]